MLDVGIIGPGPQWELQYGPAVHALRDRLRIRAVFDPVKERAEQIAAGLQAFACSGILTTVSLSPVRAVLLLDNAWYRGEALSFAIRRSKPVFVADITAFLEPTASPERNPWADVTSLVVPSLPLRYTPATARLRELMATRLGPPEQITIDVPGGTQSETSMIELLDWCRYLAGTTVHEVEAKSVDSSADRDESIRLSFARPQRGSSGVIARLKFAPPTATAAELGGAEFCARVVCENGTAEISGLRKIAWTRAGERRTETLDCDRDAMTVLLDLFCRRVVGGLVPIPSPDDVSLAANVLKAVAQSRRKRGPVILGSDESALHQEG